MRLLYVNFIWTLFTLILGLVFSPYIPAPLLYFKLINNNHIQLDFSMLTTIICNAQGINWTQTA